VATNVLKKRCKKGYRTSVTENLAVLWKLLWGRSNRFNEVTIVGRQLGPELGVSHVYIHRMVAELISLGALEPRRGGKAGAPKTYRVAEPPAELMRA
jgi:hypothetical protein